MLHYTILLIIVMIFSVIYQYIKNVDGLSNIISFCLFFILVMFAGLRNSSVGTDTNNYVGSFHSDRFEESSVLEIESSIEIGYLYLERFAKTLSNQYWVLLTLISFISVFFYYNTIIRLSTNYPVSFFIFITLGSYLFFFNGARQGIAAAIFSFSIIELLKNNFKKYLFWVGIAFLFHKTVLITIPLFFIFKLKFSFKNLFFLILFSSLIILFSFSILSFLPESLSFRYSAYENRGSSGGILLTVFYSILTLILIAFRPFISNKKKFDIYLNMVIFNNLIYLIVNFAGLDVNFIRLSLYFSLGFVLIWPIIFEEINLKFKPLIFIFFIIMHLIFFYIYIEKMANLTPYIINQEIFLNF